MVIDSETFTEMILQLKKASDDLASGIRWLVKGNESQDAFILEACYMLDEANQKIAALKKVFDIVINANIAEGQLSGPSTH